VGAGTFGVPAAFREGGLWATAVGTIVLGALAAYTFCTLADAEKRHARRSNGKRLTYPEVSTLNAL
jgi:amino acid permease